MKSIAYHTVTQNNLKIIVIVLLFQLMSACQKRTEHRFPPGHYDVCFFNRYYESHGVISESEDWKSNAEIISTENDQITLLPYSYSIADDTVFSHISTLYISNGIHVLGNFGDFKIYDGIIDKRGRNDYIINAKLEFHFYADHGDHYEWIHHFGEFKMERK